MASHTNFPKLKLSMLAVACMGMMSVAHAGQIIGVQQGSPSPAYSGTEEWRNGFGGWNLGNVNVKIVNAETKLPVAGKTFDPNTGSYSTMVAGDSFISEITDGAGTVMAKLGGKDWPVGEPDGVKVITTDTITDLSNNRPASCIMTTSYLSYDDLSVDEKNAGYLGYLDSGAPLSTVCGSPFQTHKRFKVSALPASIDGSAAGGVKGIDLVFNLDTVNTDGGALRRYSVLQKLNNYTGKRLSGYTIKIGTGVGSSFQPLDATAAANVHLSVYSGATDGTTFWASDDLANFSFGLFGDGTTDTHNRPDGFFSNTRANFQTITSKDANGNVVTGDGDVTQIDGSNLTANYTDLFGEWIPSTYLPKGIFFDDDNDPTTDAILQAYWDGSVWRFGQAKSFEPVPLATLAAWAANPLYSIGDIEDLVNLGLNYMVYVKDVSAFQTATSQGANPTFTVRLIPIESTTDTSASHTDASTAPTTLAGYESELQNVSGSSSVSAYDQFSLLASILAFLGFGGWMVRRKLAAQSK